MPRYIYRAYDRNGALTSGEVLSETREAVLDLIHRRGEQAVEVREGGRSAKLPWWQRDILAPGQLPLSSLAPFTRELATLVKAEIPVDEALRVVAMQPLIGTRMRTVSGRLLAAVVEGRALSEALAADGAFPEYHWRLVETGEQSGQLGTVLGDLAAFLERAAEARGKVGSALLYPAILLLAATATLAVITGVLIPTMMPIYEEARTEPPAIVAMLAGFGGWIQAWWPWVAGGAMALALSAWAMGGSPGFRAWRDRLLLRLPIAGTLVVRRDTARFARTLATLTRNGVPLLSAVDTAAGSLGNNELKRAVGMAAEALKEGGTLTAPLRRSGHFPEMALRLIAAGEHTGQLDAMLSRVADIYERTLERDVQRVTSLLTPVLTVVIGLVVGGLVISVMGALAGINELALR